MKTSFVLLAFLSHLLASAFPFLSETVVRRFGPVVGSFYLYLIGCSVLLLVAGLSEKLRTGTLSVLRTLWGGEASSLVWLVMVFYTVSAFFFYQGLAVNNGHTAEFGFFSRLDSLIIFALALSLEKERASRINILGVMIAFLAAMVVNRTGLLPLGSFLLVGGFVVFSALAATLSKRAIKKESIDPFGLLLVRSLVVMLVLGGFALVGGQSAPVGTVVPGEVAWVAVMLAALFLQGLFWSRFLCFRGMSLWQYAGLSASQAFFTWVIALSLGKSVPSGVLLGFLLLPIGEALCLYTPVSRKQ